MLSSSDDKSQSLFRTTCSFSIHIHWQTDLLKLAHSLIQINITDPPRRKANKTSNKNFCVSPKWVPLFHCCYVGDYDDGHTTTTDGSHLLNQFGDHNRNNCSSMTSTHNRKSSRKPSCYRNLQCPTNTCVAQICSYICVCVQYIPQHLYSIYLFYSLSLSLWTFAGVRGCLFDRITTMSLFGLRLSGFTYSLERIRFRASPSLSKGLLWS